MENIKEEQAVFEEKAELLKALAHPVRLCIVRGLLQDGDCNVTKMYSCLDIPQSTVSQHLAKLKAAGVVEGIRDGVEVHYHVISDEAKKIIADLFVE
ncbi:MAG: metalloregulator ArsR/SmtB family transcription factor [Halanaerobium sp.]|nr:metalloregulator ArsR/SmtB family transcription factor [Halanaerobium sp.]